MRASVKFVGTATVLLQLGEFTVLTDPNFLHQGQLAYLGKGLFSRRLTEPAMQPSELPSLDCVVLHTYMVTTSTALRAANYQ